MTLGANRDLLRKLLDPRWEVSHVSALDAVTYAATENLDTCARLVLWAVAVDAPNALPVLASFAKYFQEVVSSNVTLFADCAGPHVMRLLGRYSPAADKYAKRANAVYDRRVPDSILAWPEMDEDALLAFVQISRALDVTL